MANPTAGADLVAPGVASRLVDQPAQFPGLAYPGGCPLGAKLIDTDERSASWLLKKIQGTQGACGTAMPEIGTLTATDKSCLVSWIDTVPPCGN